MAVRLPDGVRPVHYALDFEIDPGKDRFRGTGAIEVELAAPARVVWLHGRDLDVRVCEVEAPRGARAAAAFEQVTPHGLAKVTLPRAFGPGRVTLRFAWEAAFGDAAAAGLHRWRTGGDVYVLPQFGGVDAGRAFPAFADMRFKAPFDVSVTVPAALVAVSNEAIADEDLLPGGMKRVRFATTRIRDARDHLLGPAERPLAEAVARRLYRPALNGDGFEAPPGEARSERRRRVELVRFLAEVARDAEVRREAERRGLAYADVSGGQFHPDAVQPELALVALRVALEERGAALYEALLPRLEHAGGAERANLVYALALADSPPLAGRAGALWRDPRLRPVERIFPALLDYDRGIMRRTYARMRTDLDAMAAAVPTAFVSLLPLAAREVCDAEELARVREILERAVARHPSMRTSADRALEQIEVCLAEREAEETAARVWFERAALGR
jgi:hypothetical protein